MCERLISIGLDVGTTTTQMVISALEIENAAGSFSVPQMQIRERNILYRSPVCFTPLLEGELVDAQALRNLVDNHYRHAGLDKHQVDTGAVIITGETSRKENAGAVVRALANYAGDFVVATAGPDLESRLAAQGAGAVEYSRCTGKTVLHMDIGGGTSNLALIENGRITATGCLNVGGRLLKLDQNGIVTYVSPVLEPVFPGKAGDRVNPEAVRKLADRLVAVLEAAAGLRNTDPLLSKLQTAGAGLVPPPANAVISFSGGVADCVETAHHWLEFSDMGPMLGQAIRSSLLCRGEYMLARETIRATVIGAGCHSAQLSGSTVFYQNIAFPLKGLPAVPIKDADDPARIQAKCALQDQTPVLAIQANSCTGYSQVAVLAQKLVQSGIMPLYLALEADIAKALGQQLALRLGPAASVLCIDRVKLEEGFYLDVGEPVGPAVPVVVKTLVLERTASENQ